MATVEELVDSVIDGVNRIKGKELDEYQQAALKSVDEEVWGLVEEIEA